MLLESIVPFGILVFILIMQMLGRSLDRNNTIPSMAFTFIAVLIINLLGHTSIELTLFTLILLIIIGVGRKW